METVLGLIIFFGVCLLICAVNQDGQIYSGSVKRFDSSEIAKLNRNAGIYSRNETTNSVMPPRNIETIHTDRVYTGKRGGKYRITKKGRKSYDVR